MGRARWAMIGMVLTLGSMPGAIVPSHAQVGGNLAAFPPVDLALAIKTTPSGPVVTPAEFTLVTGEYYRLTVTSEGAPDWRLELPDLLQNSHLRVVTIGGIEVHLQGMVFRAIEFDQAGTAALSFVPIRPGTYRFTVGDNPIALGLPAGQAGVQDPQRRAEGRFVVK
jgi:hypothetical protein